MADPKGTNPEQVIALVDDPKVIRYADRVAAGEREVLDGLSANITAAVRFILAERGQPLPSAEKKAESLSDDEITTLIKEKMWDSGVPRVRIAGTTLPLLNRDTIQSGMKVIFQDGMRFRFGEVIAKGNASTVSIRTRDGGTHPVMPGMASVIAASAFDARLKTLK